MCILLLMFLPFKIVCCFNLMTSLDLTSLLVDERIRLDGNRKAQMVKALYESVRQHRKE